MLLILLMYGSAVRASYKIVVQIVPFVFLIWLVVPGRVEAQALVSQGQPCTVEPEEREIYTTILTPWTEGEPAERQVVESRTDTWYHARAFDLSFHMLQDLADSLFWKLASSPKGTVRILASAPRDTFALDDKTQQELQADLRAKQSRSCNIGRLPINRSKLEFISPSLRRRIFDQGDPVLAWKRFHSVFGDEADFDTVSRVGFDHSRKFAIVNINCGSGSMAAAGTLFILERTDRGWVVVYQFATWSS